MKNTETTTDTKRSDGGTVTYLSPLEDLNPPPEIATHLRQLAIHTVGGLFKQPTVRGQEEFRPIVKGRLDQEQRLLLSRKLAAAGMPVLI